MQGAVAQLLVLAMLCGSPGTQAFALQAAPEPPRAVAPQGLLYCPALDPADLRGPAFWVEPCRDASRADKDSFFCGMVRFAAENRPGAQTAPACDLCACLKAASAAGSPVQAAMDAPACAPCRLNHQTAQQLIRSGGSSTPALDSARLDGETRKSIAGAQETLGALFDGSGTGSGPALPVPASGPALKAQLAAAEVPGEKTAEIPAATAKAAAPAPPEFEAGDLGQRVSDALSWGFSNGDHRELIRDMRLQVGKAGSDFARYVTPSLAAHLRKIFLQAEHGSQDGWIGKIGIELNWPTDWHAVGVATAHLLNAIDQAQKLNAAVLTRISGLIYQSLGVELELFLTDTALEAGRYLQESAALLHQRKAELAAERDILKILMERSLGMGLDLTRVIRDADRKYLDALAQETGEAFLTDARTKSWLQRRLDAVLELVERQFRRKVALETLKMTAMAEPELDTDAKRKTIEDFLQLTEEGLSADEAIGSATESRLLRDAVGSSQRETAMIKEASSRLRLAQALRTVAKNGLIPQLRVGIEEGLKEGSGLGVPEVGFHASWSISTAIRMLWSDADIAVAKLDEEIARLSADQAAVDSRFNVRLARSSEGRFRGKMAAEAAYPDAADMALYGRAKQVLSYEAAASSAPAESPVVAPRPPPDSLAELVSASAEADLGLRKARLKVRKADKLVEKSRQLVNVEIGVGGGSAAIDSVLPTLAVTIENLGSQGKWAETHKLAQTVRESKAYSQLVYTLLHDSNDYLFALSELDAAVDGRKKVESARGGSARLQQAYAREAEAAFRVTEAEVELQRLLGPETALPARDKLKEMFSLGDDKLAWDNPLFKPLSMDSALREAGVRVDEGLAEVQRAQDKLPQIKIYLSSVLALVLFPALPLMPILVALDVARTLFGVLGGLFSGKSNDDKEKILRGYRQVLADKEAAERLGAEFTARREELKAMAGALPRSPKTAAESHELNRWRISALAYGLSPGSDDFLADQVREALRRGDTDAAVKLWTESNAKQKLEAKGPSEVGRLLRRQIDGDSAFKWRAAEKILDSGDWMEMKLLLDLWTAEFRLDFGPELGGRIMKTYVKRYAAFAKGISDPELDAFSMGPLLEYQLESGGPESVYALYRARTLTGDAGEAPAAPAPKPGELQDSAYQRTFSQKVIHLFQGGRHEEGARLLSSAVQRYKDAGMDFDAHYPGLQKWAGEWEARSRSEASVAGREERGAAPSLRLDYPGSSRSSVEYDLRSDWRTWRNTENRSNGRSWESYSTSGDSLSGSYVERHNYSFFGPMGPLGDMRLSLGGSVQYDPDDPFSKDAKQQDSYYSLGTTQRSLLPGLDLTEKLAYRLFSDGTRRTEYGFGLNGAWDKFTGFGDFSLLRDSGGTSGSEGNHYRTYGQLNYGGTEDPQALGFMWQADDLYGHEQGKASGEYNLSGRSQLPLFSDPHRPEAFFSGTLYHNRDYLTTGRYYSDTYRKDLSFFIPGEEGGVAQPDGQTGYAGLRQLLVDGKYGGVGMGYAVQSEAGTGELRQYRTVSYLLPGDRGQVDFINSDDPSVGPAALQAQLNHGPYFTRVGVDASSTTFALGARSREGDLHGAGQISVPNDGSKDYSLGLALGTTDSSYRALWSTVSESFLFSMRQGNPWYGNSTEFDYRKSQSDGERLRYRVTLGVLAGVDDWTPMVPFGPVVKSIIKVFSSESPKDVQTELEAVSTRRDMAQKAGELLEAAGKKAAASEAENRQDSSVIGDVIVDVQQDIADFRQEGRTATPYSWKPAFQDFIASLEQLVPMLKLAQEEVLFAPAQGESPAALWSPRVVEMLDDVLRRYEDYRSAYRDQIWAIPVSGGQDKRPQHVMDFNRRSQWFADYVRLLKKEFLEFDHIGKMDDAEVRQELNSLARLKEEGHGFHPEVSGDKVRRLMRAEDWIPTTGDIPISVLENRINRLLAERQRRASKEERSRRLKSRSS